MTRAPRWRGLLARAVVVAAGVAALHALRPGVLENGVRSPRVWLAVLVTLLLARGAALLVRHRTPWPRAGAVASTLVVALAAVLLLAPSFRQRTVDEPFPAVAVAAAAPAAPAPAAVPSPPPAEPVAVAVASGSLEGVGHAASGRVVVYRVADRLVLRFEDVDVEGTPAPYVHLVPSGAQDPDGGTLLGGLTAERGSFSYELPAGEELPTSVLVWCRTFATPIATAQLAPA